MSDTIVSAPAPMPDDGKPATQSHLAVAIPAVQPAPPVMSPAAMLPYQEKNLSLVDIKEVARLMSASGFFKDANHQAQAFAKIMTGRDLGLPASVSLREIVMVQGKPTLSANLVAAMIKASGKYRYKILVWTNTECQIEFLEKMDGKWESQGVSSFTIEDAKKADLLKNPTWQKFPRNMLFARATTNGARLYCGDVFLGGVYTPDELDPNLQAVEDVGTVAQVVAQTVTTQAAITEKANKPKKVEAVKADKAKVEALPAMSAELASDVRAILVLQDKAEVPDEALFDHIKQAGASGKTLAEAVSRLTPEARANLTRVLNNKIAADADHQAS